jgi:hypothetical protein
MSKKIRILVAMLLSVVMLAGTVPASAYTVSAKNIGQGITDSLTSSLKSVVKNPISASALKITNDHPSIKLSALKNAKTVNVVSKNQTTAPIKAMSDTSSATPSDTPTVYNVSGSYFENATLLTSSSSQNYYTFSVNSDRYMILGLSSANTSYYLQLYQYQTSSGNYVATNLYFAATENVALNDLPAGDYLLAVFSIGAVGDSYTIGMNASNPSNPANVYYTTFANTVCGYANSLYANGTAVYSGDSESGTALDWQYDNHYYYSDYDRDIDQFIRSVKIDTSRAIASPAPYNTAYASSDDALLIPIKGGVNGTIYRYSGYLMKNGTILSFNELFQLTLNYDDYLVYDLATNKVIDLKGNDNVLYGGNRVTSDMLQEVESFLQRILQLATFSESDTLSNDDRARVQREIDENLAYIDNAGSTAGITNWSAQFGLSNLSVATTAAAQDAVNRTNNAINKFNPGT